MRKIRILSVIIFVMSAAFFVYFKIADKKAVDKNGPQINMEQDTIEVLVEAGDQELLAGVTASDKKDGDVSDSLVIESMTNFTERGKRTAVIAAFDSDHNVTKAAREIIYSDYTPPSFALSAPLYFPVNTDSIISSLTASDSLDGNLTQNIKISAEEEVWVNTAGDYRVVFSVTNSAGDQVQLPVTVTIYNPSEVQSLPVISLTQYLIHIKKGETVDAWSYVDEVSCRGRIYKPDRNSEGEEILAEEITGDDGSGHNSSEGTADPYGTGGRADSQEERKYMTDIEITNPVDANTPGTYEIVYKVTSDEEYGYETGTMRLIVVVDEQGV